MKARSSSRPGRQAGKGLYRDEIARAALPEILLLEDLARALRLAEPEVESLLLAGTIPGTRIGGRWVVSREAFLAAIVPPPCPDCLRPGSPCGGRCSSCSARFRGKP